MQVYIVYMSDKPKEEVSTSPLHLNMLEKVISSSTKQSQLHSSKVSTALLVILKSLPQHLASDSILPTESPSTGPNPATLTGFAPWLLSVAASSINRKFLTKVRLGNNKIFEGIHVNPFDPKNKTFPLIYGLNAPNSEDKVRGAYSRFCRRDSLDKKLVNGKTVYCDSNVIGQGPFLAGAAGFIGRGRVFGDPSFILPLPGTYLNYNEASEVYKYLVTGSKPIATTYRSEEVTDTQSPYIPSFSSRGPNPITPNLLKINPEAEFAYGADLINPVKALFPGLVYDADELDYVRFLCGEGYSNDEILVYNRE
ncbi:hypothetical protein FEM48_Zijuj03G0064900 [Ziziphus jujuba var. spinosa]|uniref:Uncharacterized protein n=1 Tax=Ziziphus jujuba var. spinosa TaxID=714518 RepID=A0A978VNQ6_ZIZJJ|nr:hypothetical protein FEM48_Zijuj03G0064900 [Ziziphus jujuba var. spinosa]